MPTPMRWISKTPEDLLFANTYMYRVSRNVLPKTYAILTRRSDGIAFENMKVFSQTRLAFDNAVYNEANGAFVRSHFFTRFAVNAGSKPRAASSPPASLFDNATLQLLKSGFSNASGLTVDDAGTAFFTDAVKGKIFRWNGANANRRGAGGDQRPAASAGLRRTGPPAGDRQ